LLLRSLSVLLLLLPSVVVLYHGRQARTYIDRRCVFNERALLDAGTFSTKGSVQVIVPHQTASYEDGPSEQQRATPMDTLRFVVSRDCFAPVYIVYAPAVVLRWPSTYRPCRGAALSPSLVLLQPLPVAVGALHRVGSCGVPLAVRAAVQAGA
jgi:hypothetical protein